MEELRSTPGDFNSLRTEDGYDIIFNDVDKEGLSAGLQTGAAASSWQFSVPTTFCGVERWRSRIRRRPRQKAILEFNWLLYSSQALFKDLADPRWCRVASEK
jgi:hypothetical protein